MRLIFSCCAVLLIWLAGCSPNNVKVDDSLGRYFTENNVTGCFGLMNNGTGKFTIYNLARYRDSSYLPASTFKIVNSLIGLQTGVISSDSMVIPWDGVARPVAAWNRDLNMYDAFRVSAVPYYQEVARRIGKDSMEHWLNRIHYGARTDTDVVHIQTAVDTFWLDNSLRVTPDQQLGLVKMLYFDQLGFFKIYQEAVKRAMLFEDTPDYRLGYKTGWSGWDPVRQRHIGWIIGWIEENKHPYFFVLNIESHQQDFDMPAVRIKMLKEILGDMGFMKGKM